MKKIIYSVLVCAAAVGCSSNPVDEVPVAHPYDIQISSGVEASATSKAAITEANALTDITFLQVDATTASVSSFTGAKTFLGNRAAGASVPIVFTSNPAPRYLLDDQNAFLKAYHPAGTVAAEAATWTIDGKTDILISDGVLAAGKYSNPTNSNAHSMTFKHVLAQLQVICVAAGTVDGVEVAESVTQDTWGTITSIELKDAVPSYTYTYATNVHAGAGTPQVLPLLNADYNTTFAAGVVLTKTPSPAVTAAGMFVPAATGTAPLTLIVKTTKVPLGKEVSVQLKASAVEKGFEAGLKHTVTLTFNPDKKNISVTATTIAAWGPGYNGSATVEK